jgi:hypothetical protein
MNDMISHLPGNSSTAVVPVARVPIAIRLATVADVPFMDRLQRLHTKQVGFFPTAQFEGNIKQGKVLVAEEGVASSGQQAAGSGEGQAGVLLPAVPVGYCIGADRYFKHDDVGIIFQMNVLPGRQRSLVGAMLLKEQFERSAYGCKLYCCWCAQDIAANKFWEAMGFVALAFRTGSAAKSRIHIFWQKRIRSGDTTTPWWFPSETAGGAVRENRLVLPIPPGTHWSDAKPLVLPGMEIEGSEKQLPGPRAPRVKKSKAPVIVPGAIVSGGLRFSVSAPAVAEEKPKREKKKAVKNDPKLVAAARELRDRWLEQVNSGLYLPESAGKYDISRTLSGIEGSRSLHGAEREDMPLLIEQAA